MMRLLLAVLCTCTMLVTPASADWRWADPNIKKPKAELFNCKTSVCKKKAKYIAKLQFKLEVAKYDYKKEREWHRWTTRHIPDCTWLGESGPGPEFADWRYTVQNSSGSGARGKFQFMPQTYYNRAKYHDWSPLDQEIAARREFLVNGTSPWQAC